MSTAEAQRQKLMDAAKQPLAKKAAEKAGDKLVEQAREQTVTLEVAADAQITKLTSK